MRKMGKKLKKQKSSMQKLIAKIDKLWGSYIRKRDNNLCQWCLWEGKEKYGNQPHHIIPKARGKALRWDIFNGITLCFSCHHVRIQQYPVEFGNFIQGYLYRKGWTYGELKDKAKETKKYSIKELESLVVAFESLLDDPDIWGGEGGI